MGKKDVFQNFIHTVTERFNDCAEGECDEEVEIAKISAFIRCGLFVLSVIFISGMAIAYGQNHLNQETVNTSHTMQEVVQTERKLPIYCVDTTEKKVALSFDAAWGESCLLESRKAFNPKAFPFLRFNRFNRGIFHLAVVDYRHKHQEWTESRF